MSLATPSQTIGPFFAFGLRWLESAQLVAPDHPRALHVDGFVFDGDGAGVPDAVVEVFQADEEGRFAPHAEAAGWTGFGRILTAPDGEFSLTTVKPASIPRADGLVEAPHICVSIFARGLLQRVITRVYFPDERTANDADPVLRSVAPERRATLVARGRGGHLHFDIHLQGEAETVFFNC